MRIIFATNNQDKMKEIHAIMADFPIEIVSLKEAGIHEIYIVVGYKKDAIIRHFGNRYHYVEQTEQKGTGHAVLVCEDRFRDFDGTVLVTFGDMPLFRRENMLALCDFHESRHASCTLLTAQNPELKMWARIVRDGNGSFANRR